MQATGIIEEVLVKGARLTEQQYASPTPINVVDRAEIERRQARSVEDLLRGMPGVTASGGPRPEAVNPNVRGLGDGRVVVELFVGGEHFPGNQYVPNPDLKPESAQNVEAGVSLMRDGVLVASDRLRGRVAVFRNDIEDFIEQVVRGAPTNTTRFDNVDDARVNGLELELRYDCPDWYLLLAGTRLRGDDRGTGLPLESIPADELMVEGAHSWLDTSQGLGVRATATRSQPRVPPGPHSAAPTGSHNVPDLFARWQPLPRFSLSLGVGNLTDRTYRRHLTQIHDRGRTVKLATSYRF